MTHYKLRSSTPRRKTVTRLSGQFIWPYGKRDLLFFIYIPRPRRASETSQGAELSLKSKSSSWYGPLLTGLFL